MKRIKPYLYSTLNLKLNTVDRNEIFVQNWLWQHAARQPTLSWNIHSTSLYIFMDLYLYDCIPEQYIYYFKLNMDGNTISSLLQQLASTLYLWDSYIWAFSLLLMNSILLFENIIFHAEYLGDFSPSFCDKCCYKFSCTNFLAHICKKSTGAYTKEWNCWFMTHIYILSFTTFHQIVLQCRYPRIIWIPPPAMRIPINLPSHYFGIARLLSIYQTYWCETVVIFICIFLYFNEFEHLLCYVYWPVGFSTLWIAFSYLLSIFSLVCDCVYFPLVTNHYIFWMIILCGIYALWINFVIFSLSLWDQNFLILASSSFSIFPLIRYSFRVLKFFLRSRS